MTKTEQKDLSLKKSLSKWCLGSLFEEHFSRPNLLAKSAETSSLAASAVEKYFTDIQSGIDSEYHSQGATQVAGFSITNIQVEDPGEASASKLGEQKGMIRQGPDRNRELSAIVLRVCNPCQNPCHRRIRNLWLTIHLE